MQYPYSLPSSKDFHEISISPSSPLSFQEFFSPPSSSSQTLVHSAFVFPNTAPPKKKKKKRQLASWENWESRQTQHGSKIKVFLLFIPITFTKRGKQASLSVERNMFLPLISMHKHLPWLARQLARMLPTECLQLHLLFSASMCMGWMGRQAGEPSLQIHGLHRTRAYVYVLSC